MIKIETLSCNAEALLPSAKAEGWRIGYLGEVWQRGFSEVRVEGQESYLRHREYIAQNPVRAGVVDSPEKFPYCFSYLAKQKAAGSKETAQKGGARDGQQSRSG